MDSQKQQRALIIGGTGGIGLELAISMAEMDCEVLVAGRTPLEKNPRLTNHYFSKPLTPSFIHIPWTYSTPAQGLTSLQEAIGLEPQIDILVISFGPYRESSVSSATPEDWQSLVDSNLTFPGMVTSWLLPGMRKRMGGKILFFGATGSDQIQGKIQTAIYQAAKTGLSVLAKSIAKEAAKDGISSLVLCPGYTLSETTPDSLRERARSRVPKGHPSEPSDYIPIFQSFLQDKKGLMNGAIINCGQGLGT